MNTGKTNQTNSSKWQAVAVAFALVTGTCWYATSSPDKVQEANDAVKKNFTAAKNLIEKSVNVITHFKADTTTIPVQKVVTSSEEITQELLKKVVKTQTKAFKPIYKSRISNEDQKVIMQQEDMILVDSVVTITDVPVAVQEHAPRTSLEKVVIAEMLFGKPKKDTPALRDTLPKATEKQHLNELETTAKQGVQLLDPNKL